MADYMFVLGTTEIEFDPDKDELNRTKHKYSLSCAADIIESYMIGRIACIFSDEYADEGVHDEPRFQILAEYEGKVVQVVCTWRNEGKTVRIISMHRANDKECEALYSELRAVYGS